MGKRTRYHSGIKLVRNLNTRFDKQYFNIDFGLKRSTMKLFSPIPKSLSSDDKVHGLRTYHINSIGQINSNNQNPNPGIKKKRRNIFAEYQPPTTTTLENEENNLTFLKK